jgi:hypothetical protein
MIFSVQRFLEDYFQRRDLADVDQYAIRLANVYDRHEPEASEATLVRDIGRVRTTFYSRNKGVNRRQFEAELANLLRRQFKKKSSDLGTLEFRQGFASARARIRGKRRSIESLLSAFKKTVEARAVDSFWRSRKKRQLRSRPEMIAQGLLVLFAKGVIGSNGLVLSEFASGIGFVDVGISLGRVLHLIELKIFKGGRFKGASQLATYMDTEGRQKGWLVLINTREDPAASRIPSAMKTSAGLISIIVVNVNPAIPSA